MKKVLIISLLFCLTPESGHADVIPSGHHTMTREVVISNISSYPDISVIAYIKGPMIQKYEAYKVKENTPLVKGYKFNSLNIFVIKNTYLEAAGGLDNIDCDLLAQSYLNGNFLEPQTTSVPDENPLVYEKITYTVQCRTDAGLKLRVSERVLKYNDGTSDLIETY